MEKKKIMIITGTRPELIKMSVLLRLLQKDKDFKLIFVHSGQHYDEQLFKIILSDLELPKPDYNVQVGSFPNSVQTGKMLISFYEIIKKELPDIILAQGDTNTVFAAALTAFKNKIPFGHLEAGIRSFDMQMPEEINRMLTGVCTTLNFAPTKMAVFNLLNEGIFPRKIFLVGNTVVDSALNNQKIAMQKSNIEKELNIKDGERFIVFTCHRPSNVDNEENIKNIINSLLFLKECLIIFPIHPRTKKKLQDFNLFPKIISMKNIKIIDPVGYLDFLKLMSLCYFIITDSGGLQEEANIFKKPCLTLRDNTERPESIQAGGNILVGNKSKNIVYYIKKLWNNELFYKSMIPKKNPFGDGHSSEKIIQIIRNAFIKDKFKILSSDQKNEIPYVKLVKIDENSKVLTIQEFEDQNSCLILEIFDDNGFRKIPLPTLLLTKGFFLKVRFTK